MYVHFRFPNQQRESTTFSAQVNICYLSSPEKRSRMSQVRQENKILPYNIKKLKIQLTSAISNDGVVVDEALSQDVCKVMEEKSRDATDFFISIFKKAVAD